MRGGLGVLSGSKIGFLAKFWLGLTVSICLQMQTPAPFLVLLHLSLSPGKLIPIDYIIQDSLNLGFWLDLANGRHHQGTSGREKSGPGAHPLHCPHPRAACFWQWQCFSKMPAPCHVDPLLCLSFLLPPVTLFHTLASLELGERNASSAFCSQGASPTLICSCNLAHTLGKVPLINVFQLTLLSNANAVSRGP